MQPAHGRPGQSRTAIRRAAGAGGLLVALGLLVNAVALAQAVDAPSGTDQPASTDQPADTGALQEVTVTATRREQSLSKVPISVTALSAEDMEARGIKDIGDIARFTPGVSVDTAGTDKISIRGISSSGGSGTTGIYIDDTPIQMRTLAFSPDEELPKAFDIARVEVLRGPQGTLFGAGSEGGTVRYITTQPSLTTPSVAGRSEISFTQGGTPSYELGAAAGGPLIDGKVGARVTVWYRKDGGWINTVDPTAANPSAALVEANANYAQSYLVRLAGIWAANDTWTITPSIYFQKHDAHNDSAYWPIYSNPSSARFVSADPNLRPEPDKFYLPALKIEGAFDAFHVISNTSFYHRTEQNGYEGTIYDLGFYQTLLNPGAYTNFPLIDGSGIHLPAGLENYRSPNSVDNGQENFVQELRLVSNDASARLAWTTGLFFSINRQTYLEQLHDPLLQQFWQGVAGLNYTDVFTDENGNPLPYNQAYPIDSYFLSTHAKDTQIAWYGEATYAITDELKATVGLRESHTKFDFTSLTGGPQLFNSNIVLNSGKSENSFTPKVNLDYQFTPADMVYATYAKGFRPGGGNNPLPAAACAQDLQDFGIKGSPSTYNSDTVDSFEVGTKDRIGGQLRVSASVYYIKWHNIQQTVVPPICQITFIANLGEATAKGGDIQIEWVPTDSLTADLTAGYTDARYTKDSAFSTATPDANGNVPAPIALSGDAVVGANSADSNPATPPFTVSLGLEYHFNVAGYTSFARLDYEYEARDKWLPPTQDPLSAQYDPDAFTLPSTSFLSARAGMNLGDFTVEPFVDNLSNTHVPINYNLSVYSSTGASRLLREYSFRPRTYGVTFTYKH